MFVYGGYLILTRVFKDYEICKKQNTTLQTIFLNIDPKIISELLLYYLNGSKILSCVDSNAHSNVCQARVCCLYSIFGAALLIHTASPDSPPEVAACLCLWGMLRFRLFTPPENRCSPCNTVFLAITMEWRLPVIKMSSFDTHKTIKQVKRTGQQQSQQDERLSTFFGSSVRLPRHTCQEFVWWALQISFTSAPKSQKGFIYETIRLDKKMA